MAQWVLPLALLAGFFLLYRLAPGGCCGGHAPSRHRRGKAEGPADRAPETVGGHAAGSGGSPRE